MSTRSTAAARVRAPRPGPAGDHRERARGVAQPLARGAQARRRTPRRTGSSALASSTDQWCACRMAVAYPDARRVHGSRRQEGSAKCRPPMSSTTGSPSRPATVNGSAGSRVGERRGRHRAAAERARQRQHGVGEQLHAAQRRGQLARLRVRRHRARRNRAQVAERERRGAGSAVDRRGSPRRRRSRAPPSSVRSTITGDVSSPVSSRATTRSAPVRSAKSCTVASGDRRAAIMASSVARLRRRSKWVGPWGDRTPLSGPLDGYRSTDLRRRRRRPTAACAPPPAPVMELVFEHGAGALAAAVRAEVDGARHPLRVGRRRRHAGTSTRSRG